MSTIKPFFVYFAIVALCILLLVGVRECKRAMYSDMFGKQIVLGNDTVTVIDYNVSAYGQDGYVLSNGLIVKDIVVEQCPVVK